MTEFRSAHILHMMSTSGNITSGIITIFVASLGNASEGLIMVENTFVWHFLPKKCDRLEKRTHSTQKQDKRESVEYGKRNNSDIPLHLTNIELC